MSLAALLIELRPLIVKVEDNWERIVALLHEHRKLAEYEVARFYVARHMAPKLGEMLRSADPQKRRQAAYGIGRTCTRAEAARLLRPIVKDPDTGVRNAARSAVHALGIADVALPDTRFKPPRNADASALGRWNPTGWNFGLQRVGAAWQRKPKPPRQAARLDKLGLPALHTVPELARWLGLQSAKELRRFQRPGAGVGAPYVEFTIAKSSGGLRTITAPRPKLKKLQRRILGELVSKFVPHPAAHGFVPGRSVITNARPHVGAQLIIKMDLRDFFPTIHYRRVLGLFQHYGYEYEVAAALASLCTHRPKLAGGVIGWPGALPQGAPTSPALANVLCRRLDSRLAGLAKRADAVYTRYADDLTFSFKKEPAQPQALGRFLWWVDQVCHQRAAAKRIISRTYSAEASATARSERSARRAPTLRPWITFGSRRSYSPCYDPAGLRHG